MAQQIEDRQLRQPAEDQHHAASAPLSSQLRAAERAESGFPLDFRASLQHSARIELFATAEQNAVYEPTLRSANSR
jgi:hypothetical protein